MSRLSPLEVLLVAGLLAAVGLWCLLGADPTRRNVVYAPTMRFDMAESPGYESQDPNPNFPDGKTLQRPPPGTIARGHPPLAVAGTILDTVTQPWNELSAPQRAAWNALQAPWDWAALGDPARAAVLRRGQAVYETFCIVCHGPRGAGDGPVTKRGVPPPKPFTDPAVLPLSDGRMFRSVSYGQANMPAYRSQVEREDRWKVIRYIRTLQQAP